MTPGLRDAVAATAASPAFGRLLTVAERLDRTTGPVLTVLTYHRIDRPGRTPHLDPSLVSATPEGFAEQMDHVARECEVVSLEDVLAIRRGDRESPRCAVMLTFDDAYRDFAEHAWPILRRHRLPATLFVPTAYPDRPELGFWWDRIHVAVRAAAASGALDSPLGRLDVADANAQRRARRLLCQWVKTTPQDEAMAAVAALGPAGPATTPPAVLGWAQLRALAGEGVALAPHTRTHRCLDRLPVAEVATEVQGSLQDLEREIGSAPRAFAFPAGGHTDSVVASLRDAGLEVAFTTSRGANDLRQADWLRLRRVNVGLRSGVPAIRAQLIPWAVRRRPAQAAREAVR